MPPRRHLRAREALAASPTALVACCAALAAGCESAPPPFTSSPAAEDRAPIVGGELESGYPLVGALAVDAYGMGLEAFCTATAVTPTVIITAAHCLDAFEELYGLEPLFYQTFEDGSSATTPVVSASRETPPEWDMWSVPGYFNDIGLARLEEPLDASRFPRLLDERPVSSDAGQDLLAVGFGITGADENDAGVKRSVPMELVYVSSWYIGVAVDYPDDWRGICNGDSGGPAFVVGEDREVQWGVHARGESEACGRGQDTSVGYFYDDFLAPTVLALDPTALDCGDGVCTGLEDTEGCPMDCAIHECGNGTQEDPEVCDDGNLEGGDGCSADCASDESCGNDVLDEAAGEACDDGNTEGGDGCSADCASDESCGNGVLDEAAGEVCDDGNEDDDDGCSADCQALDLCGDGERQSGEVCDDGNLEGGDGCAADCASDESCGNGVLDEAAGEVCDDGNADDGDECPSTCGVAPPEDDDGGGCGCRAAGRRPGSLLVALLRGVIS